MFSENAVSPRASKGSHAKSLHLAASNSSVVRVGSRTTTKLRLVSSNDALDCPAQKQQPLGTDEPSSESRDSFLRMSIAAALAPGLWLLHIFA